MGESFLEKNLAEISRYNKKLADKIAEHEQLDGHIDFIETKCDDINLSYNGVLLHDDIDPQEEAFDIFRKVPSNKKSTIHILFGLGLGYLFKRFCLSSKGKIIVYEPNLDILRITLENVDFFQDLRRNDIVIIDSIEDIQKNFEKLYFGDADVNLSFLKSYTKMYPDKIHELTSELSFIKSLYANNYDNLFEKCYSWTYCGIRHLPETIRHYDLESLRNKFKDKPAVIISAGPSLTKNIDILKDYKDKIVTFCVGTALKTTLNHKIEPDFLTVVEAQDCSFQIIGTDVSNTNVILQPMTHRSFHDLSAKRHFNYLPNNDFTAKWLAKLFGINIDDYNNKGTVSMCALFSARIMGCNPIILIGQDLAYTDGKCYSSGSIFEKLKCVKNEKTGKFEIQTPDDLADILDPQGKYPKEHIKELAKLRFDEITENLYQVKGQNGEMLWTEPGYAMFIRYFENAAADFADKTKFINSTEGGAYLEGFEHIPLRSALEKYAKEDLNAESIIHESVQYNVISQNKRHELIAKELDQVIKLLNESFIYFEDGKLSLERLIKQFNLNRMNLEEFKKACGEILTNFLTIENRILGRNILIWGLVYSQFSKIQNYLNINDSINEESIEKLIQLSTDFFVHTYNRLKSDDLPLIQALRDGIYESCNPTS
ncbi:MAG: hypothetical protein A2287_09975 [Candidatus Melainabacteria bacterium RIFOXYA12_FULL_32_12]|nr:MAG: hypothetical protein A2255_00895 [Candidatus Melainabacteria bacterium RIFOXYA2_FULL_32_9]OGI31112.1 MAG: hypothetical protein A2287_09975 [Candidatus Melainabacteria bacterium RIFOXYA12_FULL_32_12]